MELTLEADGLMLQPHTPAATTSAHALIGCTGDEGPALPLEQLDPALHAHRPLP